MQESRPLFALFWFCFFHYLSLTSLLFVFNCSTVLASYNDVTPRQFFNVQVQSLTIHQILANPLCYHIIYMCYQWKGRNTNITSKQTGNNRVCRVQQYGLNAIPIAWSLCVVLLLATLAQQCSGCQHLAYSVALCSTIFSPRVSSKPSLPSPPSPSWTRSTVRPGTRW